MVRFLCNKLCVIITKYIPQSMCYYILNTVLHAGAGTCLNTRMNVHESSHRLVSFFEPFGEGGREKWSKYLGGK